MSCASWILRSTIVLPVILYLLFEAFPVWRISLREVSQYITSAGAGVVDVIPPFSAQSSFRFSRYAWFGDMKRGKLHPCAEP